MRVEGCEERVKSGGSPFSDGDLNGLSVKF